MAEFLFCMTSLLFLSWVILLKLETHTLRENIQKLEDELEKRRGKEKDEVDLRR